MNSKQMKKKPGPGGAKKPAGIPLELLQKQAAAKVKGGSGVPASASNEQQKQKKVEEDPISDSSSESSVDEHDPEFEHPDDAEDLEDYKPDGYHPVYLGEKFKDGRYIVIQKLGWGHFSTVWLAEDKESNTHVALKIQKSKKSYQEAAVDEIQLLGDLRKYENSEKWAQFMEETRESHPDCSEFVTSAETFCVKQLDNFIHFGVHGKHYCSTFEIMGPNLLDLIQHFDDFDRTMKFWLVKLIARQCLAGLVYVHDVCGMIHTDIKPENVMIQLNAEYFDQFLAQLKKINKKPFSMYFLKKQQQNSSKSANAKKDKKKDKKKAKKKAAQNTEAPAAATTTEKTAVSEKEVNEESVANSATDSTAVVSAGVSVEASQPLPPDSTVASEPVVPETEKKSDEKEVEGAQEQEEEEEKKESKKEKKHRKSSSHSSCSSETTIHDFELYTLMWKKEIPIALDKLLKIKLVDFGNACWNHKQFTDNIQTREYRSPEVILGIPYTYNTDVFSLACMIYELCTNEYLFKPRKDSETSKNDEHLALFQESLGKFKKDFALSGSRSRDYFNKNGQLIRIKDIEEYPISKILVREYEWDVQEAKDLEAFLLPMLNYNPAKRISAREAIKHPWLWN